MIGPWFSSQDQCETNKRQNITRVKIACLCSHINIYVVGLNQSDGYPHHPFTNPIALINTCNDKKNPAQYSCKQDDHWPVSIKGLDTMYQFWYHIKSSYIIGYNNVRERINLWPLKGNMTGLHKYHSSWEIWRLAHLISMQYVYCHFKDLQRRDILFLQTWDKTSTRWGGHHQVRT